jgi:hypothetical protein
MEKLEDKAN